MFKNIVVYRMKGGNLPTSSTAVATLLEAARFTACGATQMHAMGWIAPRDRAGALVESVGGQWILRLQTEAKMLPASVVKQQADERAEKLAETTGRKIGRRELKDLREEVLLDLMPSAFTKLSTSAVWINPAERLVVVEAGSQVRADEVVAFLLKSISGLVLAPMQTEQSPATCMAEWLRDQESPEHFDVDRECEIKATDDSKAKVRYTNHTLALKEIQAHIQEGKLPTKLALTWDGRLSFVLTDTMQLKRISMVDGALDDSGKRAADEDRFDADVSLITGELSQLLPALATALGGESVAA